MIKKTKRDSKSDDRLAIRKSVVMELSPAQMARVYGGDGGIDPEEPDTTSNTCEKKEHGQLEVTASQQCC